MKVARECRLQLAGPIFKRPFETKFGQKRLKNSRVRCVYGSATGLGRPFFQVICGATHYSRDKSGRLADARGPRYIKVDFPLIRALTTRLRRALRLKRSGREQKGAQPKTRDGPSIHLSHARFVQDLSG